MSIGIATAGTETLEAETGGSIIEDDASIQIANHPTGPLSLADSSFSIGVAVSEFLVLPSRPGVYTNSAGVKFEGRVESVAFVRRDMPSEALEVTFKADCGLRFSEEIPSSGICVPGIVGEVGGAGSMNIHLIPFGRKEHLEVFGA